MCRKYIFEKYTSNAIRAIGIRPFLQFDESEIRGIHPLRNVLAPSFSCPFATCLALIICRNSRIWNSVNLVCESPKNP